MEQTSGMPVDQTPVDNAPAQLFKSRVEEIFNEIQENINAANQRYQHEREELLRKVTGMEEQLKRVLAELDPDFLQEMTQMNASAGDLNAPVLSASLPVNSAESEGNPSLSHPNTLN